MAGPARISQLPAAAAVPPVNGWIEFLDAGDTTDAATGTNKRVRWDGARAASLAKVSASATATSEVTIVDASGGARIITLPTAADKPGAHRTVKKADTSGNAVTVVTVFAELIDDATSRVLPNPYDRLTVVSDGAKWHVV